MKTALERQASRVSFTTPSDRFRVGDVDINPRSGQITGPGGTQKLDPKVMAVLLRLAAESGLTVSRDTLMKDVWGDLVVTDFALSRCIYQLRKALAVVAETDNSPIDTLPKRGYRLAWPVNDLPAIQRPDHRYVIAGVSAVLSLIGILLWSAWNPSQHQTQPGAAAFAEDVRLVVFPFEDLSTEQNQQVFATGLAREILHRLAAVPSVSIIGRISAFDTGLDSPGALEHARLLNADFVLGGSVQAIGASRRVLVDLQNVPDGELIWSREFTVEPEAPFDIVRSVAEETVQRFRFASDPSFARQTTVNIEAFESYLQAYNAENLELRREALLRAVELDPKFARAWNGLAASEVYPVWNGETTVEDAWSRAQPYVEKALEIDPNLPDAYVTLGRFRREFGDLDGAIDQFRKALELDPAHPSALANLGIVLRPAGRYQEALAVHELGVRMDSLDALAHTRLGTSQWLMENHTAAARHYEIAAALKPDDEEIYDSWSAMLSLGLGRYDEGLIKIDRKMVVEGLPTPRTLTNAGQLASVLGLNEMAERYLQLPQESSDNYLPAVTALATHYYANREDEAARILAEQVLEDTEIDSDALLIIGALDIESGNPGRFLDRIQQAFPEIHEPGFDPGHLSMPEALLIASAFAINDRQEIADHLAQSVVDKLTAPRSYQHLWLAAAYALQGDSAAALSELRVAPSGWVRRQVAMLPRDPRFTQLHKVPEFRTLVADHLQELDRQRDLYLANTRSAASMAD